MALIQPAFGFVFDSEGDLRSWALSSELRALGHSGLPLQITYVGPELPVEETGVKGVEWGPDDSMPYDVLKDAFLCQANAVKDAESWNELQKRGLQVNEKTLVVFVGRAGNDLVFRHFVRVIRFFRRVTSDFFPGQQFHFAALVLLPNLFASPTREDFARSYVLLRQLNGYQEDPPPFQVTGRPIRLLDTIWLANSSNERGQNVGRFPEAGHALTTFLKAMIDGIVDFDQPIGQIRSQGMRPVFSSFGCATLCLDREYLNAYLFCSLMKALLPETFLSDAPSRDRIVLEAQKFLRQSSVWKLFPLLEQNDDGSPLWPGYKVSAQTIEKYLFRPDSLFHELSDKSEAFVREALPDLKICLQNRRETLEAEILKQVKVHAGGLADQRCAAAARDFLLVLVEDPPEEPGGNVVTEGESLFGLLGAAIDHLDAFLGYSESQERIRRAQMAVAKLSTELVETHKSVDLLQEQIRSFDARGGVPATLQDTDLAALQKQYEQQKEQLIACLKKIDLLRQQILAARAGARGLLIAKRNFQIEERRTAVEAQKQHLESKVRDADNQYREAVQRVREGQVHLDELFALRRGWMFRHVILYPAVGIVAFFLLNAVAFALLRATASAVGAFYAAHPLILLILLAPAFLYVIRCFWEYFFRVQPEIRKCEENLKQMREHALRKAWELLPPREALLRFDLDLQLRQSIVVLLTKTREHGRQLLDQVHTFLDHVGKWASEPSPPPPASNLYRTTIWEVDHIERIFQSFVPDRSKLTTLFRAQMGQASKWVFLGPEEAYRELRDYSLLVFQALQPLSIEELLFHPNYGVRGIEDRLAALYQAASPYLLLKYDSMGGISSMQESFLVLGGNASPCVRALQERGLSVRFRSLDNPDQIVAVRTRIGFPAHCLAEIEAYWGHYLRTTGIRAPEDPLEVDFKEIISSPFLERYRRRLEAFLVLWCHGTVKLSSDGFWHPSWGESLGSERRFIYARLVVDPVWDELAEQLLREAAVVRPLFLRNPNLLERFQSENELDSLEKEVLKKMTNIQSIGI